VAAKEEQIVYQAGSSGYHWLNWRLLFGISLVLGAWMLVLWHTGAPLKNRRIK
jgi:hypothetical protein